MEHGSPIDVPKAEGPARVVVGDAIAAPEACDALRDVVDDAMCVVTPERSRAVGDRYEDSAPTTDGKRTGCTPPPPPASASPRWSTAPRLERGPRRAALRAGAREPV